MKHNTRVLALTSIAALHAASLAEPVEVAAFMALPRPLPSLEVRYGPGLSQAVDVFLPPGCGPYPVAVLVHGGCWSINTAGREQLRHLGAELARRGIAAWSIGYRRANEAGGAYPGSYLNIAAAFDRLRDEAGRLSLDLGRSVAVGHSAGGHLALWAAARAGVPAGSPLRSDSPWLPAAVISVAGIGDLKAFLPYVPLICGNGIAEQLHRTGDPAATDLFDDVSPAALPPAQVPVRLISPVLDRLVPPHVAHTFAQAMRRQGKGNVDVFNIADAGHFDPMTTGTPAWALLLQHIEDMLQPTRGSTRAGALPATPARP